jgi:hypothetical protein
MSFNQFNFKKEVIVFVLLWIISTLLIANALSGNQYQGQNVILFYASLITSSFYPALFLFFVYLALWSIVETIIDKTKKAPEQIIEPEEPVNQ